MPNHLHVMFKTKTLFIIGAGASCEADLPTGNALKKPIAESLNIRFRMGSLNLQVSGDQLIATTLASHARNIGEDYNNLIYEAWRIRDALPLAISIDNFLDAHAGNHSLELCGKLAIARAILDAERKSRLFIREGATFDPGKISDTWYNRFFKLLTENVRKRNIENIFENVFFIVFNYDRCIEHFLYHSLQNYYGVSRDDADRLVSGLQIAHPYGAVGSILGQAGSARVPFGNQNHSPTNILEIARQVKTFTEQVTDNTSLEVMRGYVQEAETIVFLGFAFHEQNMELLSAEAKSVKRIFGTAKGISGADLRVVEWLIRKSFRADKVGVQNMTIEKVRNELTCAELFDEYWRTLPWPER